MSENPGSLQTKKLVNDTLLSDISNLCKKKKKKKKYKTPNIIVTALLFSPTHFLSALLNKSSRKCCCCCLDCSPVEVIEAPNNAKCISGSVLTAENKTVKYLDLSELALCSLFL